MSESRPSRARYESLDCWRAIACLAVCVHHLCRDRYETDLWLGVQLFFVISGYCMTAAIEKARATGVPLGRYFARRLHRIAPPYLASVALTFVVAFVNDLRAGGPWRSTHVLSLPWEFYVRNVTLTQWTATTAGYVEGRRFYRVPWSAPLLQGPYWSLGYEEQFYIFLGLLLLVASLRVSLGKLLLAATVGAVLWNRRAPGSVTGLIVDYWLQFACGIALYYRLCRPIRADRARALDGIVVVAVIALAAFAWERSGFHFRTDRYQFFSQLVISATFALVLLGLRSFDGRIVTSAPGRALAWVGRFSYSLYLVHDPLVMALEPTRTALASAIGFGATQALTLAVLIAVAYVFSRAFERPFLNAPEEPPPTAPVPALATTDALPAERA